MNERLKTFEEKMKKTIEIWTENFQQSVQDVRIQMC